MKPCRHQTTVDGCKHCWLYVNNAACHDRWSEETPKAKPQASKVSLPCIHLGDAISGQERERLGLAHGRDWRQCESRPSYGVVCRCLTCGPNCKGYVATKPE